MGALSLRTLELDGALGLDLDRRSALGLCPVALRPVGADRRALGVGPRRLCRAPPLRAGSGCVHWYAWGRLELAGGGCCRLVPARTGRGLLAELHARCELCSEPQPR